MAAKYKLTKQQVLIRFAVQLGISVLIGSSDIVHITEDLMMVGPKAVKLSEEDMDTVMNIYKIAELDGGQDGHDETTRVKGIFHNELDHKVEVYWDDGLGALHSQGEIEPFMTRDIQTFHSHAFVVKDQNGDIVKKWIADAGAGSTQKVTVSQAVEVTFENQFPERKVNVYWIDEEEALTQQGDGALGPGDSVSVSTEHGHQFVVKIAEEGDEVDLLRWTANVTHGAQQMVMVPQGPGQVGLTSSDEL